MRRLYLMKRWSQCPLLSCRRRRSLSAGAFQHTPPLHAPIGPLYATRPHCLQSGLGTAPAEDNVAPSASSLASEKQVSEAHRARHLAEVQHAQSLLTQMLLASHEQLQRVDSRGGSGVWMKAAAPQGMGPGLRLPHIWQALQKEDDPSPHHLPHTRSERPSQNSDWVLFQAAFDATLTAVLHSRSPVPIGLFLREGVALKEKLSAGSSLTRSSSVDSLRTCPLCHTIALSLPVGQQTRLVQELMLLQWLRDSFRALCVPTSASLHRGTDDDNAALRRGGKEKRLHCQMEEANNDEGEEQRLQTLVELFCDHVLQPKLPRSHTRKVEAHRSSRIFALPTSISLQDVLSRLVLSVHLLASLDASVSCTKKAASSTAADDNESEDRSTAVQQFLRRALQRVVFDEIYVFHYILPSVGERSYASSQRRRIRGLPSLLRLAFTHLARLSEVIDDAQGSLRTKKESSWQAARLREAKYLRSQLHTLLYLLLTGGVLRCLVGLTPSVSPLSRSPVPPSAALQVIDVIREAWSRTEGHLEGLQIAQENASTADLALWWVNVLPLLTQTFCALIEWLPQSASEVAGSESSPEVHSGVQQHHGLLLLHGLGSLLNEMTSWERTTGREKAPLPSNEEAGASRREESASTPDEGHDLMPPALLRRSSAHSKRSMFYRSAAGVNASGGSSASFLTPLVGHSRGSAVLLTLEEVAAATLTEPGEGCGSTTSVAETPPSDGVTNSRFSRRRKGKEESATEPPQDTLVAQLQRSLDDGRGPRLAPALAENRPNYHLRGASHLMPARRTSALMFFFVSMTHQQLSFLAELRGVGRSPQDYVLEDTWLALLLALHTLSFTFHLNVSTSLPQRPQQQTLVIASSTVFPVSLMESLHRLSNVVGRVLLLVDDVRSYATHSLPLRLSSGTAPHGPSALDLLRPANRREWQIHSEVLRRVLVTGSDLLFLRTEWSRDEMIRWRQRLFHPPLLNGGSPRAQLSNLSLLISASRDLPRAAVVRSYTVDSSGSSSATSSSSSGVFEAAQATFHLLSTGQGSASHFTRQILLTVLLVQIKLLAWVTSRDPLTGSNATTDSVVKKTNEMFLAVLEWLKEDTALLLLCGSSPAFLDCLYEASFALKLPRETMEFFGKEVLLPVLIPLVLKSFMYSSPQGLAWVVEAEENGKQPAEPLMYSLDAHTRTHGAATSSCYAHSETCEVGLLLLSQLSRFASRPSVSIGPSSWSEPLLQLSVYGLEEAGRGGLRSYHFPGEPHRRRECTVVHLPSAAASSTSFSLAAVDAVLQRLLAQPVGHETQEKSGSPPLSLAESCRTAAVWLRMGNEDNALLPRSRLRQVTGRGWAIQEDTATSKSEVPMAVQALKAYLSTAAGDEESRANRLSRAAHRSPPRGPSRPPTAGEHDAVAAATLALREAVEDWESSRRDPARLAAAQLRVCIAQPSSHAFTLRYLMRFLTNCLREKERMLTGGAPASRSGIAESTKASFTVPESSAVLLDFLRHMRGGGWAMVNWTLQVALSSLRLAEFESRQKMGSSEASVAVLQAATAASLTAQLSSIPPTSERRASANGSIALPPHFTTTLCLLADLIDADLTGSPLRRTPRARLRGFLLPMNAAECRAMVFAIKQAALYAERIGISFRTPPSVPAIVCAAQPAAAGSEDEAHGEEVLVEEERLLEARRHAQLVRSYYFSPAAVEAAATPTAAEEEAAPSSNDFYSYLSALVCGVDLALKWCEQFIAAGAVGEGDSSPQRRDVKYIVDESMRVVVLKSVEYWSGAQGLADVLEAAAAVSTSNSVRLQDDHAVLLWAGICVAGMFGKTLNQLKPTEARSRDAVEALQHSVRPLLNQLEALVARVVQTDSLPSILLRSHRLFLHSSLSRKIAFRLCLGSEKRVDTPATDGRSSAIENEEDALNHSDLWAPVVNVESMMEALWIAAHAASQHPLTACFFHRSILTRLREVGPLPEAQAYSITDKARFKDILLRFETLSIPQYDQESTRSDSNSHSTFAWPVSSWLDAVVEENAAASSHSCVASRNEDDEMSAIDSDWLGEDGDASSALHSDSLLGEPPRKPLSLLSPSEALVFDLTDFGLSLSLPPDTATPLPPPLPPLVELTDDHVNVVERQGRYLSFFYPHPRDSHRTTSASSTRSTASLLSLSVPTRDPPIVLFLQNVLLLLTYLPVSTLILPTTSSCQRCTSPLEARNFLSCLFGLLQLHHHYRPGASPHPHWPWEIVESLFQTIFSTLANKLNDVWLAPHCEAFLIAQEALSTHMRSPLLTSLYTCNAPSTPNATSREGGRRRQKDRFLLERAMLNQDHHTASSPSSKRKVALLSSVAFRMVARAIDGESASMARHADIRLLLSDMPSDEAERIMRASLRPGLESLIRESDATRHRGTSPGASPTPAPRVPLLVLLRLLKSLMKVPKAFFSHASHAQRGTSRALQPITSAEAVTELAKILLTHVAREYVLLRPRLDGCGFNISWLLWYRGKDNLEEEKKKVYQYLQLKTSSTAASVRLFPPSLRHHLEALRQTITDKAETNQSVEAWVLDYIKDHGVYLQCLTTLVSVCLYTQQLGDWGSSKEGNVSTRDRQTIPYHINRHLLEQVVLHWLNTLSNVHQHADSLLHMVMDLGGTDVDDVDAFSKFHKEGGVGITSKEEKLFLERVAYAEEVRVLTAQIINDSLPPVLDAADNYFRVIPHFQEAITNLFTGVSCESLLPSLEQGNRVSSNTTAGTTRSVTHAGSPCAPALEHHAWLCSIPSYESLANLYCVCSPSWASLCGSRSWVRGMAPYLRVLTSAEWLPNAIAASLRLALLHPLHNSGKGETQALCEVVLATTPLFSTSSVPSWPSRFSSIRLYCQFLAQQLLQRKGWLDDDDTNKNPQAISNEELVMLLAVLARYDAQTPPESLASLLQLVMSQRVELFGEPPAPNRQGSRSLVRVATPPTRHLLRLPTTERAADVAGASRPSDEEGEAKEASSVLEEFTADPQHDPQYHTTTLARLRFSLPETMELGLHLKCLRRVSEEAHRRALGAIRTAHENRRERLVTAQHYRMHQANPGGWSEPRDTSLRVLDYLDPQDVHGQLAVGIIHLQFALQKILHWSVRHMIPTLPPPLLADVAEMLAFHQRQPAVGGGSPQQKRPAVGMVQQKSWLHAGRTSGSAAAGSLHASSSSSSPPYVDELMNGTMKQLLASAARLASDTEEEEGENVDSEAGKGSSESSPKQKKEISPSASYSLSYLERRRISNAMYALRRREAVRRSLHKNRSVVHYK